MLASDCAAGADFAHVGVHTQHPPRSLHPNASIRSHLTLYDAHQCAVFHLSLIYCCTAPRTPDHRLVRVEEHAPPLLPPPIFALGVLPRSAVVFLFECNMAFTRQQLLLRITWPVAGTASIGFHVNRL